MQNLIPGFGVSWVPSQQEIFEKMARHFMQRQLGDICGHPYPSDTRALEHF